jgi:predicted ribosome quality control (RQC) complex YloA/Tae2 family protein
VSLRRNLPVHPILRRGRSASFPAFPAENAQKYYKKYTKLKNTAEKAKEQYTQSLEDIKYLESVQNALNLCETAEEIEEIREELIYTGYLREQRQKKGKKQIAKIYNPSIFKSSDGFTIYVGKNNRQNDYLTLKLASSKDIWFHTKDVPGSHVVISCAPNIARG